MLILVLTKPPFIYMKNYSPQTLKIFWQHIKRYRVAFFLVSLFIVLSSVGNIIGPLYYKEFFDLLTSGIEQSAKVQPLIGILVKILLIYLISWFFWRLSSFMASNFQTKVMRDLANTCFAYLHKHSINFFNNNFVGSLVKKVNRFSRSFDTIFDIFFYEVLQIVTNLGIIVAILFYTDTVLGLIVVAWVFVYVLVNYSFSLYKMKYDLKRSETDSEATGVLADTITNHQNVKLFNGYNNELNWFSSVIERLRLLRRLCWNLGNVFEAFQALLMVFLEIGMFYFGLKLWLKGLFTVGDFVLIQAYVIQIFHRLWNFGRVIRNYYEHMADANEMTEILQTPHEITDVRNASELEVTKGEIVFKNVSFSYHKTRRAFSRLNLVFQAKERVALVGPSGAGKTTLVNLLLRNYDLGGGKIYIDGQKISSVTQESLHQSIGLVPQDPILFHRTLMENIRYGKPEAGDAEVIEAAKLAYCHGFISQFPEGYNTYVGERGVKLSGGERQRVAIARAILKNAPVLILDEATSSLDSESEGLIQKGLSGLMQDKTVVVIAHRLSTIMKMDRIIVLNEGKVVERGSHQQLVKKRAGLYQRLWQKQAGGFIN